MLESLEMGLVNKVFAMQKGFESFLRDQNLLTPYQTLFNPDNNRLESEESDEQENLSE